MPKVESCLSHFWDLVEFLQLGCISVILKVIFPLLCNNTSYHAQVQTTTEDLCWEGVTISRDKSEAGIGTHDEY